MMTTLVVGATAFLLFAVVPFARSAGAREANGGAVAIFAGLRSPATVVSRFIHGPDTEMIAALSVEVSTVPGQHPYFHGGATFGDLLESPIPKQLFPSKPMTARDRMLVAAFGSPCTTGASGCRDFSAIGTF